MAIKINDDPMTLDINGTVLVIDVFSVTADMRPRGSHNLEARLDR